MKLTVFRLRRGHGIEREGPRGKASTSEKNDKEGHDHYYRDLEASPLMAARGIDEYVIRYESSHLRPFYRGGTTKGYVRGLATHKLMEAAYARNTTLREIKVLDAGCGQGELSVYLACNGFTVVGVDISPVACVKARQLAAAIGVDKTCTFLAEDLVHLSLSDASIDYIIGHAALHHFVKYEGVPSEFARVLRPDGEGFFADSFGENKLYHLFHDKQKMRRLGDASLTKLLVERYFSPYFDVELHPTDWFVMLDKVYERILPSSRVSDFSLEVSGGPEHFTPPSPPAAELRANLHRGLLSASRDRGSLGSCGNFSR